jgi:uncharacterized protein with GYD domain
MSTTMIVKNTLKDYDQWRSVFDANKEMRLEYGIEEKHIYQTKADYNQVIVVMEVEDVARVQAFMKHIQETGLMDDAGVLDSEPTPCNDVT